MQLALSKHIETGHQILFDKTTTIANIASHALYISRKYREAIEIQKHPNNLNRDNGYNINKIWKTFSRLLKTDQFPPSLPPPLFPQFSSFPSFQQIA